MHEEAHMDAYSSHDNSSLPISQPETSTGFTTAGHSADIPNGWHEEREALHAALDAARRTAEDSVRQRDELLSAVAHDLRGPLNSIFGWVQLLQGGRLEATQQARALEAIVRGTQAQTKLIDSLLDVSRALGGRLQLSVGRIDASEPLQGAVDAIIERAAAKGVAVHTAIEPGGHVNADSARLRQLFSAILDNAVRCTPQGGTISVMLTVEHNFTTICFTDNGVGIASEALPRVFEPFQRAEAATGRSAGRGLGVGLAIARQIVTLHGGSIEAHSEGLGRGARFIVRLPVVASAASSSSQRKSPERTARPSSPRQRV